MTALLLTLPLLLLSESVGEVSFGLGLAVGVDEDRTGVEGAGVRAMFMRSNIESLEFCCNEKQGTI